MVFGGDWQSSEVWWWENPSPRFDPARPWTRRIVKQSGAKQHHDQASFHGPVGLQPYSLRDMQGANLGLRLQSARGFGFREVELAGTYGLAASDFRARLDCSGLRAGQEAGIRHFFIEDESTNVLRQIPQSLRYLESLAW